MKSTLSSLVFFTIMLAATPTNAQLGWQWGINAAGYGHSGTCTYVGMYYDALAIDKSGNTYIAGTNDECDSVHFGPFSVYDPYEAYKQLFLTKVDSNGNYQWAIGSSQGWAGANGIATDNDGNIYLLGWYSAAPFTIGNDTIYNPDSISSIEDYCYFLMKVSPSGTIDWIENVGDPGAYAYNYNTGYLQLDAAGNIYISGTFSDTMVISTTTLINHDPTNTSVDVYVAKYNPAGTLQWADGFGSISYDYPGGFAVSSPGDVYVSCQSSGSNVYFGTDSVINPNSTLVKIAPNGDLIWAMPMSEGLSSMALGVDAAGQLYSAGLLFGSTATVGSSTLTNLGFSNMYLAKYDTMGNPLWAVCGGGNASDAAISLGFDLCGNVWVGGDMGGVDTPGYSMTFGSNTLAEPPGSYEPMFIVQYDSSGDYLNGIALPGGGNFSWNAINTMPDDHGNLMVTGLYYAPEMVFAADTLYYPVLPTLLFDTSRSYFMAKYKYQEALCNAELPLSTPPAMPLANGITLFPDPASRSFTVCSNEDFLPGATIAIYDITGRLAGTCPLYGASTEVTIGNLAPGMYECRITSGTNITVKKLSVMQ